VGESAVWTGRHMLVWGDGLDGYGLAYDAQQQTWNSITGQGAPLPRQGHSAVWTGSTMLIWGSYPYTLLSGGRYFFGQHSDQDGDGVSLCDGDCDDTNASVYPGAPEMCNARDDNCNGVVDEDAAGADTDGDGTPNACDACPNFANPGQSSPLACIGA